MSATKPDPFRRDRLVLNVVFCHIPLVVVLGTYTGYLIVGIAPALVAAAICTIAYSAAKNTKIFQAVAGVVLMIDSGAMIAASGGQVLMHVHVFIAMTFLIMYFEWLPIVVAGVTIILHHAIGDVLFPTLVFGQTARMCGDWFQVLIHSVAVGFEVTVGVATALRVRNSAAALAKVANVLSHTHCRSFEKLLTRSRAAI